MLRELTIHNLALIRDLHIDFGLGFTALTGETGSGKSLLLGALRSLQGGKAKDLIRADEASFKVEAIFSWDPQDAGLRQLLDENEIDCPEEIILERQVFRTGKNRCRINGSLVNVKILQDVAERLFDIYGQQDHRFLRESPHQLMLLDKFGGLQNDRKAFAQKFLAWKSSLDNLHRIQRDLEQNQERQDYLEYRLKELNAAGLQLGEEENLETKIKEIAGAEQIQKAHLESLDILLEGTPNIADLLNALAKKQKELSKHAPYFEKTSGEIANLQDQISDLARHYRNYHCPPTQSVNEIDKLNSKLALWQRLKSKYKTNMEGLIALRDESSLALDKLNNSEVAQADAEKQVGQYFKDMKSAGILLTQKRMECAQKFTRQVNRNLNHLGMDKAEITCQWITANPTPLESQGVGESGFDTLELYLSANQGHNPKPLAEIASGGEASRIMLAIKSVLAIWDSIPLMIFDEIDSGIGGVTGNRVGEALKNLAKTHQVMAITHLHQVAAQAKSHIKVSKREIKGKTDTLIEKLSENKRVEEIARMMGDQTSSTSLGHAQSLLQENTE